MKVGGQILWNVTPICETSQIYYLMGRRPMKDVLGNHLKDRLFHLVHWLSITLLLRRTSQESINLERKSYLDCSSDTHCTRGEFGSVTYWLQILRVADLEFWEPMLRQSAPGGYLTPVRASPGCTLLDLAFSVPPLDCVPWQRTGLVSGAPL